MNILFLISTANSKSRYHPGLASISAVLKAAGHKTSLLSVNAFDKEIVRTAMDRFAPALIVASSNSHQYSHVREIFGFIREAFPGIKIIIGGPHAMLHPDLIDQLPEVDAVCKGEGEGPLLQYVEALEKGTQMRDIPNLDLRINGKIVRNPVSYYVENLDDLPFPDYSIFPLFEEGKPLPFPMRFLFNRGCPYDCKYCCNHKFKEVFPKRQDYVRFKSPQRVVDELKFFSQRYGFDHFVIDDDIFTLKKDWLLEFCGLYPDELKSKTFEVNVRVGTADDQMLKALKDIGCRLIKIGIESGSERIRREVLGRPMAQKKIIETARMIKSLGLELHTFNMIGVPTETRGNVWETIGLNRAMRPDKCQLTVFYPYANTALGDYCFENKLIGKEGADTYFLESIMKFNPWKLSRWELFHYVCFFKFYIFIGIRNRLAGKALIGGLKRTYWSLKEKIPFVREKEN